MKEITSSDPTPNHAAAASTQGAIDTSAQPDSLNPPIRQLIARSVFRDITTQVEEKAIVDRLIKDFRVTTATQMLLVSNMARAFIQIFRYNSTIESVMSMKRAEAARGIIDSRFHDFYPPSPGTLETVGLTYTAFGRFMATGGVEIMNTSDTDAIKKAIAIIASDGRPESDLDDRARVLGLREIEKLERMIAAKMMQIESLSEQLLRLIDRMKKSHSSSNA